MICAEETCKADISDCSASDLVYCVVCGGILCRYCGGLESAGAITDVILHSHITNLRETEAEMYEALAAFIDHGFCPNCGCDQWNTAGCPICKAMRQGYDVLVKVGGRDPRQYAPFMDADEINRTNSRGTLKKGVM